MIDPDWLQEENKLEARSQSIQTFSNSSMCLDEIKKLIETGAPREDLLDTLVTNVNTEANQQIQDPDIVRSKKYQSEVLLPTFISNNDTDLRDGIRSNSRRSLRPDKLISPETISHEEFLSPSLKKTEKRTNIEPQKCRIASIESLNTFEKIPSTNRDSNFSSLNLSLDDHVNNFSESDDEHFACQRGGMHGSRFSLNENVFANIEAKNTKPHSFIDHFKDDLKRNFRGNSLNIVYENEIFQPNNQSSPTRNPYGNISEIIAPTQNSMTKYKHHRSHKKQSTTMPIGNLKRNPSLRYSNYLKNMRVHRNSIHYRGAMLNTHRYRLKASSCPNIYRNSMTTIAKEDQVCTI